MDAFRSFGLVELLSRAMDHEENLDVKERLKTALANFGVGVSGDNSSTSADDAMMIEPIGGDRTRGDGLLFGSVYDEDTGDFMRMSDHS